MPSPTQQLKLTYAGSPLYKGIDTTIPETDIDAASSPFMSNMIVRRGEIRSRYRVSALMPAPADGTSVRALTSFFDINAVMHTICITRRGIYQLSINWQDLIKQEANPWLILVNFGQAQPDAQYAMTILQTKLYFSNGGTNIFQWNGLTNTVQTIDTLADGTTFGAFYLMELGAKIICAYTIETKAGVQNIFPFRVRWTNTPPSQTNPFDPTVNLGAGFNDEFDVPDTITGIMPIGRTGYIYRNNGISEMIPNSNGNGFDFDHLWASDRGIGNVLSQTLAGFGPMNIFVAGDNIYMITPNSFNPIGNPAFNFIALDLDQAFGTVSATILPYFSRKIPMTAYVLSIPLRNDDMINWVYDITEKSWVRWLFNGKTFTCKARTVYTQ
jgi:hypothetical protein